MSDFKEKLCSELKKYKTVIIYGYADIGKCLLDYIIDFETSIKIANYSGRVKYFAGSAKNRNSNRKEIKGIKIKSIYELREYANDALVIVATQEIHHRDIGNTLKELNFSNVLYIRHEDYCIIRESIENHKLMVNTNLQQYHLNHQMKLDRVRKKIKEGKKVKVFFLTHDSAVFGASSVYWKMMEEDIFEPYIYVVSRRDVGYIHFMEDVERDVAFFEENGFRVICGYDEFGNPKDLHLLRPDILFYDIPKLYGEAGAAYNRLDQLNWQYLTCYVPYGLLMVDSFYYHYHTKCIRETWKFFLDTPADFKRVLADGEFNGYNTILSGYPKFDEYEKSDGKLPDKLNNDKPLVIYAPHHSLFASNNFATFDLYKDIMLNLVKENPQINFVIKPHPLLPFQIDARAREGKICFTKADYEEYLKEWNNLENGLVVDQGDYIRLFKKSCCLITDCGSFIGEYVPSKNPCIYIFNPRKEHQEDVYTPLAQKILDTYYVVHTEEELLQQIKTIVFDKKDYKKKQREQLVMQEFGNIGHAGEFICEYLKGELLDS